MTQLDFSTQIKNIYDEIRSIYLNDNRPWILGFSGGKDSTCMVQLVWYAIKDLKPEQKQKKIFVISSDTLVESPKIVEQLTNTLDKMEGSAKKQGLPISTNLVRPVVKDTFWVCLLGKGFPAPTNSFRWCTDRLKIRNADRFITEKVSEYGEAIVVLGTRKDESGSREQLMNLYKIKGSPLSRHSKFAQTYVYAPIGDFTKEDVWNYLLQIANPWGSENRDLLALYKNAENTSECPLVVDKSTPSCGNSRFGCWVCTVVAEDTSMKNMIDNGEEWMQPLLELRQKLKNSQNSEKWNEIREFKLRRGKAVLYTDGSDKLIPGPYKMFFCKEILEDLLRTQKEVRKNGPDPNILLISEHELHEIQRIWRMERGDWKNSVYEIYKKVTGEKLSPMQEDLVGFGGIEEEVLQEVCQKHGVSQVLVSKLLNAEFESQGMSRHSKIYGKINNILSEEWRDNVGEIKKDLKLKRKEREGLVPKKKSRRKIKKQMVS